MSVKTAREGCCTATELCTTQQSVAAPVVQAVKVGLMLNAALHIRKALKGRGFVGRLVGGWGCCRSIVAAASGTATAFQGGSCTSQYLCHCFGIEAGEIGQTGKGKVSGL